MTDGKRNELDAVLEQIAKEHLCIPTLAGRGSDSQDFHALSVWRLKNALKAAFLAGIKEGGR